MLTLEQIKNFIGIDIFQKNPKAALIEYLQYEILDSLYKQKNSEKLSFIGGTAIRIVYQSQRFSEDLDFDNFGLNFTNFKKLLDAVAKDMTLKGFEIEFRLVEKMAFHCYIKFPNILFLNKLSSNDNEKILIRIDTVEKEKKIKPKIFIINNFGVYRKILVNPIETILSQKILTILERKREKGRDFYDVSYLFGITKPDYEYFKNNRNLDQKTIKKKLLAKIDELNMKKLSNEVLPLLLKPEDIDRVLTFREYIKQKL
ncbi:nucleotidyl transferase AbiEii/AbiGii toxin family protein [Candidatus Kuenenbacteria bacterium]|nr:nucleotidyl transferase AbiEii/AbiGii toxin family protein [Candidatus Kuenenbacteria bacterium]